MSFVNELSIEDNAAPPSAIAKITAQRIGNLLRNRYQDFIHKREAGNGTWSNSDFLSFKNACDKLQSEEYERFDEILREKQSDISMALSSFDYKFLFVMMHTGKKGAAENILSDMKQWQRELNLASLIADNTPNDDLPFQVHLVSAEDIQQWLAAGTRSSVDLDDVEIEKYGQIDEPHQAFYGLVSGDQIADWWKIYGTRLFTKNIRNLLGKTEVNDAIKVTASQNPELFWYYNNGITLLVNSVEPHRRNASRGFERGCFRFTDVSVINGAQTVSSLGMMAGSVGENLSNIKISARFIKLSGNEDIANSITKANNFQNRVLGRDFASQRPEQHRLSKEIAIEGYQYQLLRSGPNDTSGDASIIDLDEAPGQ
ncbi:TPA: AIPR family protein [Salmonella enterica subsp. enterica serovar Derby]|nr:AIPR family protein [Salmonella enterica subsp. enterica serovar Derby]